MRSLPRDPRVWLNKANELLHASQSRGERDVRLRAIASYNEGDFHEARQALSELTRNGARNEWTWLWSARTELQLDEPDWALAKHSAGKALAIRPGWERATTLLAQVAKLSDDRPIVVPMLGLRDKALLDAARDMRRFLAPNDVIVVTDSLAFADLHRHKIAFEYLPDPSELPDFLPAERRENFQRDRLAEIRREHHAQRVMLRSYLSPSYSHPPS